MPIKTFRGLIKDNGQDTISLHTNDGSMGYRIVKFQMFPNNPGTQSGEFVMKIYKVEQTTVDQVIDFSDQTLLAASYYTDQNAPSTTPGEIVTVFDQEVFNQDIYITHIDTDGSESSNYYIELEQIKLDMNQNTVATLKDIRNTVVQG
jgi:hypothetical protein